MIHTLLNISLLIQLCVSFENIRISPNRIGPYSTTHLTGSVLVENELAKFEKTGIKRELEWVSISGPIPLHKEISLLKSGVLVRKGEFCRLENDRLQEVEDQCQYLGMTLPQGLLIRRQLMVSKVVKISWKLKDKRVFGAIKRRFENEGCSLLELSKDSDQPPVSILRAIVAERVYEAYPDMFDKDRKRIIRSIIGEKDPEYVEQFLTDYELSELQKAKEYDVVGYSENTETPILWENALYTYLDEQGVNYISEEALRDVDMNITPDCLILDDCYINGQLVRWVDVKSFYGSGLRENQYFNKSLKKQIAKYETEFGESGAVVFKHGFSKELQNICPSTLLLDAGPLVDDMEFKSEEML